jgi:hypothetical protein
MARPAIKSQKERRLGAVTAEMQVKTMFSGKFYLNGARVLDTR